MNDTEANRNWPAAQARLQAAEIWREEFNSAVDHDHWNDRLIGLAAHRALRNGLLSLAAAHGKDRRQAENLILFALWSLCPEKRGYSQKETELRESVENLLEHAGERLPQAEDDLQEMGHLKSARGRLRLQDLLNEALDRLAEQIYLTCGVQPADLFPEGDPWHIEGIVKSRVFPEPVKIRLRPDEVKKIRHYPEALILKEIGGRTYEAIVPVHAIGPEDAWLPADCFGTIKGKKVFHLPIGNDGRTEWRIPEEHADSILLRNRART